MDTARSRHIAEPILAGLLHAAPLCNYPMELLMSYTGNSNPNKINNTAAAISSSNRTRKARGKMLRMPTNSPSCKKRS